MSTGEKLILFPDRGTRVSIYFYPASSTQKSNFIMQKWTRGRYSDSPAYAKQRAKMLPSVSVSTLRAIYFLR